MKKCTITNISLSSSTTSKKLLQRAHDAHIARIQRTHVTDSVYSVFITFLYFAHFCEHRLFVQFETTLHSI